MFLNFFLKSETTLLCASLRNFIPGSFGTVFLMINLNPFRNVVFLFTKLLALYRAHCFRKTLFQCSQTKEKMSLSIYVIMKQNAKQF